MDLSKKDARAVEEPEAKAKKIMIKDTNPELPGVYKQGRKSATDEVL